MEEELDLKDLEARYAKLILKLGPSPGGAGFLRVIELRHTTGHYKYYRMVDNGNGKTWIAEWGVIGRSPSTKIYNLDYWEKKLNEKLKKGYWIYTPPK